MFKKVLVAEDMDSINQALAARLGDFIPQIVHAQYCDEAFLKAKRAFLDGQAFDLLISDLSFKPDYRQQKISSGQELISTLKGEFPELKVIVNSIEDSPQTIQNLWNTGNIDAYVCKDRKGLEELEEAIFAVSQGKKYNSPQIEVALHKSNVFILPEYEVALLSHLANGLTQDEITVRFQDDGIKPHSKSSIEKRLKELREDFNANTNPHLINILKDLKLI